MSAMFFVAVLLIQEAICSTENLLANEQVDRQVSQGLFCEILVNNSEKHLANLKHKCEPEN